MIDSSVRAANPCAVLFLARSFSLPVRLSLAGTTPSIRDTHITVHGLFYSSDQWECPAKNTRLIEPGLVNSRSVRSANGEEERERQEKEEKKNRSSSSLSRLWEPLNDIMAHFL